MSTCLRLLPLALPLVLAAGSASAAGPFDPAAATVTPAALRAHVRFLADDQLGGRKPGSPGDRLARTYIQAQMEAAGLLPAGDVEGGKPGWFQWVQLVGLTSHLLGPPEFRGTASTMPVNVRVPLADAVMVAGDQAPSAQVNEAEVVFVGYGITAPEFKWDDYKGTDLRGKVLLMMNNDPESDPELFAGKTRLYYGRWDYKYREAARHGAAGAILIHTTPSASYPWTVVRSSWDGENFEAPIGPRAGEPGPLLKVKGWLTEEASRQVARAGGHDLDALRKEAEKRTFRPVPLGVRVTLKLATEIRRVQSANVLGYLPGVDAKLKQEAVVYTAHFDHLGTKEGAKGEDRIHNGALDNATGVSALLVLARAATLAPAGKRAQVFAAVTGEEDGLIGSEHLVGHQPAVIGRFVANINIDGLNIFGRSPQVVQIGRGKSSIDAVVDAAAGTQGRKVLPDQMPEKGSFYRSDQFNFARAGIPAIYLGAPVDLLSPDGKKVLAGAGKAKVERYILESYHQPSDQLRDDWSFEGAVLDVLLLYRCGQRLASMPVAPTYKPSDEFSLKK